MFYNDIEHELIAAVRSLDLAKIKTIITSLLQTTPLSVSYASINKAYQLICEHLKEQEESKGLDAYRNIENYLKKTLADIQEKISTAQELKQAQEARDTIKKEAIEEEDELGFAPFPAPDSQQPIDDLIKNKIKNNTLVATDAEGVKHCYLLELAINQNDIELVRQLLNIKMVSMGIKAALEKVSQKETAIKKELLKAQTKYMSHLTEDAKAQEKAFLNVSTILSVFWTNKKSSVIETHIYSLKTVEEILRDKAKIYNDANGNNRCYELECLIEKGLSDMVLSLLKKNEINRDLQVIKAALQLERVCLEKENIKNKQLQNATPIDQEQLIKSDNLLAEYHKMDSMLSKALFTIKEKKRKKDSTKLKEVIKETFASVTPIEKSETLALQDAMLNHELKNLNALKNLYQVSDTPETLHDREYYNSVYNALEAIVNTERFSYGDEAYATYVHYRNMAQKSGVRTAIQLSSLIAVGLSSGGVGLGMVLLSQVIGTAAKAGYGIWKDKYLRLEEKYATLLSTSETILKNAQVKSLKKLERLIQNTTGYRKEILQAQLKELQRANAQMEQIEHEARIISVEILKNLLSSDDKEAQIQAKAFLSGFHHNTSIVYKKGNDAFSKFRDVAKDITERALAKSIAATKKLNTFGPLDSISSDTYSELVSQVLDAQAAISTVTDALETHYNVLAEVKQRDELYIELAKALREQEKQLMPPEATIPHSKVEVAEPKDTIQTPIQIEPGIVESLIAATKILKEKGKDGLQDPKFQYYMKNIIQTPSLNTLSLIANLGQNTYKLIAQAPAKPDSALPEALSWFPQAQEAVSYASQYLNEHLSAELLYGLASAHLPYNISPISSCTKLTLLLYSHLHNKIFTPALAKKISDIVTLYGKKDMATMNEKELIEVLSLVGETIHDFGNLLPQSAEQHLENSKKLYTAQVKRIQLINTLKAEHNFSFRRAIIYDMVFHDTVNLNELNKNETYDKSMIYLKTNPKDKDIVIAFYHDGDKWCEVERSKEQFEKKINEINEIKKSQAQSKPWEFDDAAEVKAIATFFGCVRRPSKKVREELQQNKEELDARYAIMEQEKIQDQALHYLSGLYKETMNHLSVQTNTANRDRLFELSRQRTLVTLLKASSMNEQEQEQALPIIANYLKSRKQLIDKLSCLKLFDKASREQLNALENYKKAYLHHPYDFLIGLSLENLLLKTQEIIFSEMNLLNNMREEDIKNVVDIEQKFELFIKKGWIEKDSIAHNEFLNQLKNIEQKPNLTRFEAYLNSIEKLCTFKTENPEIFSMIEEKKQTLYSMFSEGADIAAALSEIEHFCNTLKDQEMDNVKEVKPLMFSVSLHTEPKTSTPASDNTVTVHAPKKLK